MNDVQDERHPKARVELDQHGAFGEHGRSEDAAIAGDLFRRACCFAGVVGKLDGGTAVGAG